MCQILGCEQRTLADYYRDGQAVKIRQGLWDGDQTNLNVIRHFRDLASRIGTPGEPTHRAALNAANAKIAQMKLAKIEGSLVSLEEVERVWSESTSMVRQAILAVPARVTFELPHLTKHDIEVLEREHREALRTLSSKAPRARKYNKHKDERE